MAERPLIGLSPDQVSTNGMLGDLAFQDSNSAYIETIRGKVGLDKLDKSIEDTAVDVFVYDTRKDSDGGAWRKRTQHTSWYNETLNTSTRGSRREFPAVAVIVREAGYLTIYDGDDPDLPMWMVFEANNNGSTSYLLEYFTTGGTSVTALNGIIVSGHNSNGATTINFINEKSIRYRVTGASGTYDILESIKDRNTLANITFAPYANTIGLVNSAVNDVAMTVLPNAPIDDATGLPVPTIAVATAGGVSVIKDDGTVVDAVGTGFDEVNSISFDKNNRVICSSGTVGTDQAMFSTFAIPSSDLSNDFPGGDNAYYRHTYANTDLSTFPSNGSASNQSINEVSIYGDDICFGTEDDGSTLNPGLKIISENVTSPANGMLCGVSTSYNTGWMHGDIKGAFLSDTTVESLTANTNLASNFVSGGTNRLSSLDYDSGDTSWQMVDDAASANGYVNIELRGLTIGQSYIISMTWDNNATLDAGYNHRIAHLNGLAGENNTNFTHWNKTNASSETLTGVFVAQSVNDDDLVFYANAITLNVSNFIVRAVDDEDRSVKNRGLQVFGTVTKSAVATGAELVGYSGFSASNYLIQPYNTALDFGTGDWCYMFWYNPNDAESGDVLFTRWSRNVNSSTAGRISVYFNSGNLRVDLTDDGGSSYQGVFGSDGSQDTNTWHLGCIIRRGTNVETWVDAVRYGNSTLTSVADGSYTNTSAILEIGNSPGAGSSDSGIQLALLRASASAPSPEQIKKIYEDEKFLFQENAACTLYGSSDAVTALAYDDSTNILYAGTSSGRSDFQGLRRINNTTTAVTTAMSASNGLVAEQ